MSGKKFANKICFVVGNTVTSQPDEPNSHNPISKASLCVELWPHGFPLGTPVFFHSPYRVDLEEALNCSQVLM